MISTITSSAVLVMESNPVYAKNTVEAPASIPLAPKGKYLLEMKMDQKPLQETQIMSNEIESDLPGREFIPMPSGLEA